MFNFLLHLFRVKNFKNNTFTFLFTSLSLKRANVNQILATRKNKELKSMIQFYQPVIEMSLQGASTLAGEVAGGQWALTVVRATKK